MKWLTEDADLRCNHIKGKVKVDVTQSWVHIAGRRVLVEPNTERRTISGCPNYGAMIKPCTLTLAVKKGYSSWLKIDGKPICLDTVIGLTDGMPPGTVEYKVIDPGQAWVEEELTSPRYRAFRFEHPDIDSALVPGLSIGATGGIAMADGHASVRQAILLLLSTIPGERVMRPAYGCDLFRLIFSPNDQSTAGLAIHYVRRALQLWEPRVDVLSVDARWDNAAPGILNLLLRYRVRATQRVEEFSLPVDLQATVDSRQSVKG